MKRIVLAGAIAFLLSGATALCAAEMPQLPKPTKQHAWLQKFVGTWSTKASMVMEPGKPPLQGKGSETFRDFGGFWVVGEGKGTMMGMTFGNVLTIGYQAAKKKYVASWIDSHTDFLWNYTGTVDAAGKTLTLLTAGPCPMKGGAITNFKEVHEFKGPDHRFFKAYMEDKGKWVQMFTVEAWRKK